MMIKKSNEKMKAFAIESDYGDGALVVFAQNSNKARAIAISQCEFADADYIDLHAHRIPDLDRCFRDHTIMEWDDDQDRLDLVEHGWCCVNGFLDSDECEKCCAHDLCGKYLDYVKDQLIDEMES